jgi:hypothetical protein
VSASPGSVRRTPSSRRISTSASLPVALMDVEDADRPRGVAVHHHRTRLGLHDHEADRVRDHVVQLAAMRVRSSASTRCASDLAQPLGLRDARLQAPRALAPHRRRRRPSSHAVAKVR